jgi:phage RecT family recombinase
MTTDIATTHTPSNGALAHSDEPRRFVDRLLTSKRADIETALEGSGVDFDLFRLGIARALMKEPKLERATPASLAGAVLDCARLGLVPAGYDAQAALITRGDQANLMVMVGGLIDLSLRGGRVIEIGAETVKQGEVFERDPIADTIRHVVVYPRPKVIVAAYAWAKMADGTRVFEIVDQDEIAAARKSGSGGGAWTSWEGEMAKKVAKRRLVRARRLISLKALGSVEGAVEVELDREEQEMPIAETRATRDAVLAMAPPAAPLAIASGTEVTAEARLADHDATEDARLERLRAEAEKQADLKPGEGPPDPDAEAFAADVALLRDRYAAATVTPGEGKTAAADRVRAALGTTRGVRTNAQRNEWFTEAEAIVLAAEAKAGITPTND